MFKLKLRVVYSGAFFTYDPAFHTKILPVDSETGFVNTKPVTHCLFRSIIV